MDTNIYYTPEDKGVTITSDFAEIKKWMDLGVNPKVEYIPITVSDLNKYEITEIGFDKIDDEYFKGLKEIFSQLQLKTISFHGSVLDLSGVVINVKELFIGEKSKINLSSNNFKNLEEITFLSLKTYKGKILNKFDTVKKAVLWDTTKTSTLLEMFPNLVELTINKGSLIELDLRNNKELEKIGIHYCTKLERVLLYDDHKLQEIFVENCKNLDVSNLPVDISSIWPSRKEKKESSSAKIRLTGDLEIDNLISDLKNNMEDFMKETSPSYSQKHIDECVFILTDYTLNIYKSQSKEEGMEIVKSTILELNTLNDKSDGSLIETNEREQIAEIIILASYKMKYNSMDEDITEEWREW